MKTYIDELNQCVENITIENLETSLGPNPEFAEHAFRAISQIEMSAWMAKSVCIGKMVEAALDRGLTQEKAVKDVANLLNETKQSTKKNARIYSEIISPRFASNELVFPLTDQRYFDIAVKYDQQLDMPPIEIMRFVEDRFLELGSYTPMQAKVDLGLVKDSSPNKVIKGIVALASAESQEIEEAKSLVKTEYTGQVTSAGNIIHSLLSVLTDEDEKGSEESLDEFESLND